MNSFYEACQRLEDDELGANDIVVTQTVMSHTLFQTPILKEFYRVSAYAPNGFFLSNKFEITDTVVSMSDEAREIVASMSYLQDMRNPFKPTWSARIWIPGRPAGAISSLPPCAAWPGAATSSAIWKSPPARRCCTTYSPSPPWTGVSAQAILPDGTALFHGRGDAADYSGLSNARAWSTSAARRLGAPGGAYP